MTTPSPEIRDIGPYDDADQAMQQFRNWATGLPFGDSEAAGLLLVESAMAITGVNPSTFELRHVSEVVGQMTLDPVLATILHGWIIRARIAADNDANGEVETTATKDRT